MTLRVRRGTDSERDSAITDQTAEWEAGEPLWIW